MESHFCETNPNTIDPAKCVSLKTVQAQAVSLSDVVLVVNAHDKNGFGELLKMELDNVEAIFAAEVSCLTHADFKDDNDEYDNDAGALMQVSDEVTKIGVVLDSGSVTSDIHPKELPRTMTIVPNIGGRHFKGGGTAGHYNENCGRPCVPHQTRFPSPASGPQPTSIGHYTQWKRSPAPLSSVRPRYCSARARLSLYPLVPSTKCCARSSRCFDTTERVTYLELSSPCPWVFPGRVQHTRDGIPGTV